MNPEEAKKSKCDRCGAVIGLHRHADGWRCPTCIWNERENLIEWAKCLLSAGDYTNTGNKEKQAVVVSRRGMDALAEAVSDAVA